MYAIVQSGLYDGYVMNVCVRARVCVCVLCYGWDVAWHECISVKSPPMSSTGQFNPSHVHLFVLVTVPNTLESSFANTEHLYNMEKVKNANETN